jgi:hypothetical protein
MPPVIANVALEGGSFRFSFLTAECQTYSVMCTAVPTGPWTPLAQLAGNGSVISFIDTGAGSQLSRYYCVGLDQVASINTVGFVRRILQPATNLVANPLFGTDNRLGTVLPNCPEGSMIFKMNPGSSDDSSEFSGGRWLSDTGDPSTLTLNPGEGAILVNPSGPFEVAFVGQVPQGALTNSLPGYGPVLRSSFAPVTGLLDFPAQEGDILQTWDVASQGYTTYEYYAGDWVDNHGVPWNSPPGIRPGEAFWVSVVQPTNWVQAFWAYSVGGGGWGPPVIAIQPQSRTNEVGTMAKFSVAATGAPQAYQWYFNTNTLLTNENSCTLTLSSVKPSDAGGYSVMVSNASGSVTSSVAVLTVPTAPPSQPPAGFYFTNMVLLADGRAQLNLIVPTNGVYTLLTSTDFEKWEPAMLLDGPTNRFVITSPRPMSEIGNTFLRAAVGRVVSYGFLFYFVASPATLIPGTPSISFPQAIQVYSVRLDVNNASNWPVQTEVLFTGPPGSGMTNLAASDAAIQPEDNSAWYMSPPVGSPSMPPLGTWTVTFGGAPMTFDPPDSQATTRFIVPQPNLVVSNGLLTGVSWVYRHASNGQALTTLPAYVHKIIVQVHGGMPFHRLYDSNSLPPNTTNHVFATPVLWSDVAIFSISYYDDLGNCYDAHFRP